jgi:subtilisin family serine protease
LIKASGLVSYAEPNYVTGAPEADDGTSASARHRAFPAGDATPTTSNYSKSPYSGSDLHLALARRISKGERTTVAVLDTGVQLNHPELQDRFVGVPRYDFVDDDNDPSEPPLASTKAQRRQEAVGHGTHVAGIVHLVAPKAKLMPLRVLDREGYGDNFHVAEAVAFAYMHGADVINLSLGTPSWSRLLKKQVDNAIGHGVVVTAAAGNYDSAMPQYPATKRLLIWKASDHDGLLAVTSVDPEGNKSSFANYGKWVDIAAPGEEILSTYPVSRHAYWSGTSMATPFVAGEAALIQAKRRQAFGDSLNPAKVEGRIRSSAQCHQQVNATYNHMLGSGRIDIGNGVKNVQGRPCSLLP